MAASGSPETGQTALRSDAEHNRARILRAAREALAASGDFAMNAVARQAGVGQGTLYRHFPTREALVLAVYRQDVAELVDAAPVLLAGWEQRSRHMLQIVLDGLRVRD
jgi:AcrR family transcriptional regulator